MSSRSIRRLIPLALATIAWSACAPSGADRVDGRYYPGSGDAWEHRAPAEVGMDAALVQQVVDYANSTEYGLSASVWTQNLSRAHRLDARINSGTVWINCWMLRDLRVPFGGMKNSGVGREGGEEALRFFTEPKNVCVKL